MLVDRVSCNRGVDSSREMDDNGPMEIDGNCAPAMKYPLAYGVITRYCFYFLIATCLSFFVKQPTYVADGLCPSHIGVMVDLMCIGIIYLYLLEGHLIRHQSRCYLFILNRQASSVFDRPA